MDSLTLQDAAPAAAVHVTAYGAPKTTADDGADALRIVEAARESHRQGREIILS